MERKRFKYMDRQYKSMKKQDFDKKMEEYDIKGKEKLQFQLQNDLIEVLDKIRIDGLP